MQEKCRSYKPKDYEDKKGKNTDFNKMCSMWPLLTIVVIKNINLLNLVAIKQLTVKHAVKMITLKKNPHRKISVINNSKIINKLLLKI